MRKNPFLRAEKTVIKKVYNNEATLNINVTVRSYDNATGTFTESTEVYPRTIHIANPHEIADGIVDKIQYLKGDLNVDVAYLEITQVMIPVLGERTVMIDGVAKTLAESRTRNGGIDETKDTITFDGTTYRIVKITPKSFYAGTPSKLKIQLRAV